MTSRATERHDVDEQNDNDGEDDFDDKKNNKKNADDDVNIEWQESAFYRPSFDPNLGPGNYDAEYAIVDDLQVFERHRCFESQSFGRHD